MPIDGTRLTDAERDVLNEALDTYITAQDRRVARAMMSHDPNAVVHRDDATWKHYVAMELRGQAARR